MQSVQISFEGETGVSLLCKIATKTTTCLNTFIKLHKLFNQKRIEPSGLLVKEISLIDGSSKFENQQLELKIGSDDLEIITAFEKIPKKEVQSND